MSEEIAALQIDILAINNRLKKMAEQIKSGDVRVVHESDRFRLKVERAASTKGVDGFVVDVSGDDLDNVQKQIAFLYDYAKGLTNPTLSAIIDRKDSP